MKKIKKISIGAHVSAAGDLSLAPQRAQEIACECFQFFSRPPQGGKAKPISPELASAFKANLKKFKQSACYIHAPYYINLASSSGRIYHGSINVLRQELERGSLLGAKAMMFHIGSARDLGTKEAVKKAIKGIKDILWGYKGLTKLLIENSAGSGQVIGDSFEEIARIIKGLSADERKHLGICFDTAHAFASGYDLRSKKSVSVVFGSFDKILGIENLALIHANDSKADFESKKDRHEHIGSGRIGMQGFESIIDFARSRGIDVIIETPKDGRDVEDIKALKRLRDQK